MPADAALVLGLRGITQADVPAEVTAAIDELAMTSGLSARYDCVMVVDLMGVITVVEDRVNCALGHDPADVVGRNIVEYIHPDEIQVAVEGFEREVINPDNREPAHVFRCLHVDGSWRWCETVARNRLNDPQVAGVVVAMREVGPPFGPARWAQLSAAEQEVVIAVANGLNNRETAERRCTSVRTVEAQLTSIYLKLGLTSRAQLSALSRSR